MAYEDTNCPCGERKVPDTMLCDQCEAFLADAPDMRAFRDTEASFGTRRGAAIHLIAAARSRKRVQRVLTQAAASAAFRLEHHYV